MSSDLSGNFETLDPIRALYLAYRPAGASGPSFGPARHKAHDDQTELTRDLEVMDHDALAQQLDQEMRKQSAWTLFFHSSVAERLNLNPTDHKCLDMIWRSYTAENGECVTPGQLARETQLTTGAVTGVLDRLEEAGYVSREHDPDDRRRIIVRPVPERIKADVWPLFDWLSGEFLKLCSEYTDAELRQMIEFSRRAQALLQHATEHMREMGE